MEYIFIYSLGSPSRSRAAARRVLPTRSFSWYPTAPLFIRRDSLVFLFAFELAPDGASFLVCAWCLLRATRGLQRKFELCKKNRITCSVSEFVARTHALDPWTPFVGARASGFRAGGPVCNSPNNIVVSLVRQLFYVLA